MKRGLIGLGLLLATALPALAQQATGQPVVTTPVPATSQNGNASGTIAGAATTTFQQVWASTATGPTRRGCTIVNNGANVMYVTEGLTAATSTQAKAVKLAAGQAYFCGNLGGPVLVGEIDIAGTQNDTFYAAQY